MTTIVLVFGTYTVDVSCTSNFIQNGYYTYDVFDRDSIRLGSMVTQNGNPNSEDFEKELEDWLMDNE